LAASEFYVLVRAGEVVASGRSSG